MKYLVLYEDFFSIFPANRYDDSLAVNIAITDICRKFINNQSPYFGMNEGPYGGVTIHDSFHYFTYVVKEFNKDNQTIILEIYDGKEAKLLLATVTMSSKDLKKALLTDLKNRFKIQ